MLQTYVQTFDVTENLEIFLKVNVALDSAADGAGVAANICFFPFGFF
jgi:hypothetical protein